jgi:hypothetical protein
MRTTIVAVVALLSLVSPAFAQPSGQPAPAPTLPPATNTAQPAYPPAYPYAPGYAYPPAPGYPAPSPYAQPYPPYPQPGYSPYASPYPGYPPAYAQNPPRYPYPATVYAVPPARVPNGKWRLGASLMLAPQGTLTYSLNFRGEPLLKNSGSTATTGGIVPYLQLDLVRHLYLAFAVQFLPSVKWSGGSSTNNNLFGGSGREVDLLPQVGVTVPASSRIRLLAFAAPGYSMLFASDLVKVYADPGTAHGFIFQTGFGMVVSLGEHAFLDFRGTYQWGFQNNKVQSATTGESADVEVHSRFFGLQGGGGYWF